MIRAMTSANRTRSNGFTFSCCDDYFSEQANINCIIRFFVSLLHRRNAQCNDWCCYGFKGINSINLNENENAECESVMSIIYVSYVKRSHWELQQIEKITTESEIKKLKWKEKSIGMRSMKRSTYERTLYQFPNATIVNHIWKSKLLSSLSTLSAATHDSNVKNGQICFWTAFVLTCRWSITTWDLNKSLKSFCHGHQQHCMSNSRKTKSN